VKVSTTLRISNL